MKRRSRKVIKVKESKPETRTIKCIWAGGKLVIPAEQTPSKTRYVFESGQTQPVNTLDYDFLLSLEKEGAVGCCGGGGSIIKYFEEV